MQIRFLIITSVFASHLASQTQAVDGVIVDHRRVDWNGVTAVVAGPSSDKGWMAPVDSSGRFHMEGLEAGSYTVAVSVGDFIGFCPDLLRALAKTSVPFRCEIDSGEELARVEGQVLDSNSEPLAGALIDLVRGPGLVYRTVANANGAFTFPRVARGRYKLRAIPPQRENGSDVETYYPGDTELETTASSTAVIDVQDVTKLNPFRFAKGHPMPLRGVVLDDTGKPVSDVEVQLLPQTQQSAYVAARFDKYFLVMPGGVEVGLESARAKTNKQGEFAFPSVAAGGWMLRATSAANVGVTQLLIGETTPATVTIQLHPEMIDDFSVSWAIWCAHGRLWCGRQVLDGFVYPFWVRSSNWSAGRLFLAGSRDGRIRLTGLGNSVVAPLPPLLQGIALSGAGAAMQSRPIGETVLEIVVSVTDGGSILLDEQRVAPSITVHPNGVMSSVVEGRVDIPGIADVVFLPDVAPGKPGIGAVVRTDENGRFSARGLIAGRYSVIAFRSLDVRDLMEEGMAEKIVRGQTWTRIDNVRPNAEMIVPLLR